MFICEKCLKNKYKKIVISKIGSFGQCEICLEIKNCNDIPSFYLKKYKKIKEKK